MALAVLSGLSVSDLTQAVAMQEPGRLVKVPGIGKKTADRLLLELKGKLGPTQPAGAQQTAMADHAADILRALLALGYSEREASQAARQLPADTPVSEGIRQALKLLARS
jgi:Holliday junction DNA helicase RuvA